MANLTEKHVRCKKIIDYPNYTVSDDGRVTNVHTGKVLKPASNGRGYYHVVLTNSAGKKTFYVHRLVAIHFIDNPKNLPEVNHKNSLRADNHVDNLEWASTRENVCHVFKNRTTTSKYTGVCYGAKQKKWIASISYQGRVKMIGYFTTEEDAYAARVQFEHNNNISNRYL